MKWLSRLLCALAMFIIAGGHWMTLQGVAWVRMIADYSESYSLGESVAMTLSGRYPCALCKKSAETRHKEARPNALFQLDAKVKLSTSAPVIAVASSPERLSVAFPSLSDEQAPARSMSPALRPPRC